MDPLSITTTCFSLAGAIVKTSKAIAAFSRDAKDAQKDLAQLSGELDALQPILSMVAGHMASSAGKSVPASVLQELGTVLDGCKLSVKDIESNIERYRGQKVWASTKWALYGEEDMDKLRGTLERYKSALGIGLHVFTV